MSNKSLTPDDPEYHSDSEEDDPWKKRLVASFDDWDERFEDMEEGEVSGPFTVYLTWKNGLRDIRDEQHMKEIITHADYAEFLQLKWSQLQRFTAWDVDSELSIFGPDMQETFKFRSKNQAMRKLWMAHVKSRELRVSVEKIISRWRRREKRKDLDRKRLRELMKIK